MKALSEIMTNGNIIERMLDGEFNSRSGFIAVPNPFSKRPHGCRSCDAPGIDIAGYDADGGYACRRHMSEAFTYAQDDMTQGRPFVNFPSERVSRWVRAEQARRNANGGKQEP